MTNKNPEVPAATHRIRLVPINPPDGEDSPESRPDMGLRHRLRLRFELWLGRVAGIYPPEDQKDRE